MASHSAGGVAGQEDLSGLSLCSGAGGIDLGMVLAIPGYRTVCHVERETYAAAIIVARMADKTLDQAPVWDDLETFDGRPWRGAVDIVTAGYPCQPFSIAGKREGVGDPRHLWPHVARIVGETEPPFVFLENVSHHLRLGFPEVSRGMVGMGYRLAAGLFTAEEIGAPHKRERLFILAHRDPHADPSRLLRGGIERREPGGVSAVLADAGGRRQQGVAEPHKQSQQDCAPFQYRHDAVRCDCALADAGGRRLQEQPDKADAFSGSRKARLPQSRVGLRDVADANGDRRQQTERGQSQDVRPVQRQSDMGDVDGDVSQGRGGDAGEYVREQPAWPPGPRDAGGWAEYLRSAPGAEPSVRRGSCGLAYRLDRLRLCGNGVVPLVAAHALRTLAARLLQP